MTKRALVTYRFGGGEYSLTFPADDWEDAEARLSAIRSTAKVTGWPCYSIPANALTFPFASLFVRAFVAIRNALR
jgi:hypothetical protein